MSDNSRKARYNARVLSQRTIDELKSEMVAIGSEASGIQRMAGKTQHYLIRVDGLRNPAVLILKEEMLAKGGDCAIHRDAIVGKDDRSGCLLMGTYKQFMRLLPDLRAQPFGLKYLADEIQSAIDNYRDPHIAVPPADFLPEMLRLMYKSMNERSLVMGILNTTPDSFSDGGLHVDPNAAADYALRMADHGADIIDIGGESTRPGSKPVTADEELQRVMPVIEKLHGRLSIPMSIDTYRPEVALKAVEAGVSIINDITGLALQEMRDLAAKLRVPVVIMHMKGEPRTMQDHPEYGDIIAEVMSFLRDRAENAIIAGLPREYIIIDPGIGFGKSFADNMRIIRQLADFRSLGFPILIGTSRKGFIGNVGGGLPPDDRLEGTAATVALSINNGANIVRVHDVKEMTRVARMTDAVVRGSR